MDITQNKNNLNFGAIKLSRNERLFAKSIDDHLRNSFYDGVGVGDIFMGINKAESKKKDIEMIRNGDVISPNEFATVFLHYAKECFIVGNSKAQEQKMLHSVQEIDPEARINLMM